MTIRPSTPEIITVNSEALQTQIRDLLPSQNGFGSELQASNVITPIIDLTAAAEGSALPSSLQQALAFGSQTAFSARGGTDTIVATPGFFRVTGAYTAASNVANATASIDITDGISSKRLVLFTREPSGGAQALNIDFIVFMTPGDSLSATTSDTSLTIAGSSRQVALGDGTLVQPNGFPL